MLPADLRRNIAVSLFAESSRRTRHLVQLLSPSLIVGHCFIGFYFGGFDYLSD